MSTYYIDKITGTAADTLLMAGFARLLDNVHAAAGHGNPSLMIEDCGPYWRVRCDVVALTDDDLERLEPFQLLDFLVTQSQRKTLGDAVTGFDYDAQQERRTEYIEKRASLPGRYRLPGATMVSDDPGLQEQIEQVLEASPSSELPLYAAINQMKIASSYNDLVQRWRALMADPVMFREHIRLLLRLFSVSPNPIDETLGEFAALAKKHKLGKADATLLQIVNPTTGKGLNAAKAHGLSVGGVNGFWLFELLKFAGFFAAALPQRIQGSDDRKTYVVRAKMLQYHTLQGIMHDFREVVWSNSPAKLDVLAALYLARLLIGTHRDVLKQIAEDERRRHRRHKPTMTDIISGLDVTFYKSLGSAVATMNLSFVALPDWLPLPDTPDKAQRYIAREPRPGLLTEHINIISRLEENKGEEEALVQHYRDFLSSRDPALTAFFAFTRGYATYAMRHLARKEYVPLFSTNNLEELMEARDHQNPEARPLAPILQRSGFRSIARAIRESTIRAQYRVAQEGDRRYDIAYGLGQDLARSLNQRDTFVAALMDFVRHYNAETAREEEKLARQHSGKISPELRRQARLRRLVTTEDVEDLVAIIDEHGHKVVGNLLLAYGYAFDSSTIRTDDSPLPEEPVTETEGA
jgi:hypothetical protein